MKRDRPIVSQPFTNIVKSSRLQALQQFHILDTPPEPAFDDLVFLAAQVLDTPIACITFIDAHRQWLKASIGIAVEELPNSAGFCPSVVEWGKPLIIPDTHADPRFSSNPAVTAPLHLRFYAGIPLVTPTGEILGTLCVADHVPRKPSPKQIQSLEVISRQAISLLLLRQQLNQTTKLVAEHQQAEQELRESQHQYQALIETIDGIVWEVDAQTFQFSFVSPKAVDILGYPVEQWLTEANFWLNHLHPEDAEQAYQTCLVATQARKNHAAEYRMIAADGRIVWVHDIVTVVEEGDRLRLRGVLIDITAYKQAQLERDRFFSMSVDLLCIGDFDGNFKRLNPAWEKVLGFSPAELMAQSAYDFVHPDDRSRSQQVFQQLQAGSEQITVENRYRCKDGTYRWLLWNATACPEQNIIYAIAHDITARKAIEADLQQHSQRITTILESITNAFCALSRDWRFTYVNAEAEKLLQRSRQELMGAVLWDTFPDSSDILQTELSRAATEQVPVKFETPCSDLNRYFDIHAYPSADGLTVYFSDITDQKRIEAEQQKQQEREQLMAAIAQKVRQTLDLEAVLHTTVTEVRQFLQVDRVVIYQFDRDRSGTVTTESVAEGWPSLLETTVNASWLKELYVELHRHRHTQAIAEVDTAQIQPHYRDYLTQIRVKASLVVPIMEGTKIWGLLVAHHGAEPRAWQTLEVNLLQQLATQVAIAIQQSQLYQKTQHQALREKTLSRVIRTIRSSLDLDHVFSTAVTEIGHLLEVDRAAIVQYLPEQGVWLTTADYRRYAELPDSTGLAIADADNPIAAQLKQLKIVCIGDATNLTDAVNRDLAQQFPGAWLLVPLQMGDRVWGSLTLFNAEHPYQWLESEIQLVDEVANQLAIAIQQSEFYHQVHHLNAELEHQVQERTLQFQQALEFEALLKRITDNVRDSLDEGQILETAVRELAQGLDLISCDTGLYNLEQGTSTISHEYTTQATARGITWQMADFPEYYDQLLNYQCFQFCDVHAVRGMVTLVACPIFDNKGILGDLWLSRPKEDIFSDAEIRLIQQVANQCAIAIRQARLYKAAQKQVQELEKLNQLKDDFLSTVSHELRTPMSNMRMAIQMLTLALPTQLNCNHNSPTTQPLCQKTERYLSILQKECEREISLINDLLDLQRLDAGAQSSDLSLIFVEDWLSGILDAFQARLRDRHQTLQLNLEQAPPSMWIDASALERILTELLNNACKYTPPHQRIHVEIKAIENHIDFQVTNFGCEIPAPELPHIFEKFYRVLSVDPWKQGGTGLGLALVQRLTQLMGGVIQVQSCNDQTCFTVQLPLRTPG